MLVLNERNYEDEGPISARISDVYARNDPVVLNKG